ncbi:ABC transporter ATP-binding protein [Roseibium litorale]|uniref:Sn-glycerol-3-phosphate ABC transporter ATP-binding protein UgpC n=1 Tax=Roseibium litorale TaxID=2803841 RepID=A0ABR9CNY1_9HYPH|nr:sn-glycerol-3-phosphate ABC transporter ATP-binding protein UgpC [Roseibium litorale]MBD8892566.1 sn-glycerol-3-phosphate ABC transporter ATP-binding protein UgpC [Roseibium litorale]
MSELSLRQVSKSFGSLKVIKEVDLEIEKGAFTVFVGPSGCGKSTLLRMIAGLEDITSGDLDIGGARMNDTDPSKRGIAMVFQSYALYPHMTVRQNMGFALRFAGVPKAQIDRQVMDAARILELEPLLERKPGQLSGGQRQRVAIGRAIVRHPKVFLFDEPLSNLDAELRVHMRIEIAKLHKRLGATIIYVTHDQVEAMTLADKIVVLRAGRIEQTGTPLQLYTDPDNQFVAGFIGSPKMNFLPARVAEGGDGQGGAAVTLEDFGVTVPVAGLTGLPAPGTQITAGIRPEMFNEQASESISVAVEMVEHLGSETLVHGRGAGDLVTIKYPGISAKGDGSDRLDARFNPADLLYFTGEGARIR